MDISAKAEMEHSAVCDDERRRWVDIKINIIAKICNFCEEEKQSSGRMFRSNPKRSIANLVSTTDEV